jgi:hypothetical protein
MPHAAQVIWPIYTMSFPRKRESIKQPKPLNIVAAHEQQYQAVLKNLENNIALNTRIGTFIRQFFGRAAEIFLG